MRDVAVVAFAQSDHVRRVESRNEVEMVMPVLHQVKQDVGLDQSRSTSPARAAPTTWPAAPSAS